MRVIALHGDFASGAILRRDVGIDHWEYPDWKRKAWRPSFPFVAVGYSSGGRFIGLASVHEQYRPVAAVLYESPLYSDHKPPLPPSSVHGDFPVLWIRNDRGRGRAGLFKRRAEHEMLSALSAWKAGGRDVTEIEGKGRHIETTNGWPPLRHGWDRDLNERILQWIEEVTR